MELHAGIQSLYRFKSLVLHGTKIILFKGVIILRGSSRDTFKGRYLAFLGNEPLSVVEKFMTNGGIRS